VKGFLGCLFIISDSAVSYANDIDGTYEQTILITNTGPTSEISILTISVPKSINKIVTDPSGKGMLMKKKRG
jgi:hypothetical protein